MKRSSMGGVAAAAIALSVAPAFFLTMAVSDRSIPSMGVFLLGTVALFFLWGLPVFVGGNLGSQRALGTGGGSGLGLLLGWLGVAIVLLYPPLWPSRQCLWCRESVHPEARRCKHCRHRLTKAA